MNILVVSDDHFFSCGIHETLKDEGINCVSKNIEWVSRINIRSMAASCDLVIIDITSTINLEGLFPLAEGVTNILFIVDIQPAFIADSRYFISKRSSGYDFLIKINKYIELKIPHVRNIELKILHLSTAGHNRLSILSLLNITEKSFYRMRYNLVYKFGFLRYHPLMVSYCEVISIFLKAEKYQ